MISGVVKQIWKDNVVKIDPKEMVTSSDASQIEQSFNENSIPLAGIETLHSQNIKGKGIKVGVLDTGDRLQPPRFNGCLQRLSRPTGR